MDWLNKLKQYAPDIAMAVATGGATLPQLAMKAVADAVGNDIKSESDLAAFVGSADQETMLKLKQANNDYKIKELELRLNDLQQEHNTTQETIRNGDNSEDVVVRRTRPLQSWTSLFAAITYVFTASEVNFDILMLLLTLPWAYAGLRQIGKGITSLSMGKKQ